MATIMSVIAIQLQVVRLSKPKDYHNYSHFSLNTVALLPPKPIFLIFF